MNGKPKNWDALCKSVQAGDVRAMPTEGGGGKLGDKLNLICLGQSANELGKGARPGNKAIAKAGGVKWSQAHAHLEGLISSKMIERTQVGNGAWNASVYSILYSHPVFPNHSENMREWFCIGGPDSPNHPGSDAPNHPVTEEQSSKPSGYREANHPVTEGEPSGYEGEKGPNHPVTKPEHILPLPSSTPSPIPSANEPQDGGGLSSETLQRWQRKLPRPMDTEAMGRREKEVAAWAKSKGEKLATSFVIAWLDRRNIRGLNDLWGFFLKEHALHEKEARALTPEGRADEDKQQEAAAAFSRKCANEELEKSAGDEISIEETQRMFREAK